ncbi:unnamed protein product [Bemisia tabaci]|uniref:Uncharacterized protein n=1 Tax=Bemisia tabaci TaxID=7038 RepID=A0A9P0AAJ9_BEMTA|nr:unnamed protein product [Bemisia tabaci]
MSVVDKPRIISAEVKKRNNYLKRDFKRPHIAAVKVRAFIRDSIRLPYKVRGSLVHSWFSESGANPLAPKSVEICDRELWVLTDACSEKKIRYVEVRDGQLLVFPAFSSRRLPEWRLPLYDLNLLPYPLGNPFCFSFSRRDHSTPVAIFQGKHKQEELSLLSILHTLLFFGAVYRVIQKSRSTPIIS